ncbi:zinc-dependent peptidase [Flavobacterium sp. RHBU_3]|uniref:zinc-dependent peptidase n=1 Tax=Flavobacterium sp. RHBU_3 TaxID=3391184 RepID=UPI00398517AC
MEENTVGLIFLVVVSLSVVALTLFLFSYLFLDVVETFWVKHFERPPFVHFYLFKKDIPGPLRQVLQDDFSFYRNLSSKHKKYFRHRVHGFIKTYEFHGREGIVITPEMKAKVAASWVMLTFGMRRYLPSIFEHIILYPDVYESTVTGLWHKGEFNHPAGAVVFSWKHFEEGLKHGVHNINLALHEFSHALHVCATATDEGGASGDFYASKFDEVITYVNRPDTLRNLAELDYLRNYAFTNQHEFMAVTLETFFETPGEFHEKLPELYTIISKMINYKPV